MVIENYTGVHLELFVEKLDLVGMLKEIPWRYDIPVTCSRGWYAWSNTSATAVDVPSALTGCSGPARATLTSSWKRMDKVVPSLRVIHPIYTQMAATHIILAV